MRDNRGQGNRPGDRLTAVPVIFAGRSEFRAFRFRPSPLLPQRGAGRNKTPVAVYLDQTTQAGSRRLAAFEKTQRGNIDSKLSRGIEDRRPRRDFHFALINRDLGHETFIAKKLCQAHGLQPVGLNCILLLNTLLHYHGFYRTYLTAGVAAGALFLIYGMFFVRSHRYGLDWTMLGAERAADAVVGNAIGNQVYAPAGRAVS